MAPEFLLARPAGCIHYVSNRAKERRTMMSQPYVEGITDTVTHDIASSLTADQIAAGPDTLTVSVVCPDRWSLGDFAVVTSRDGHALTGEVSGMDVCTGEVTIRLPG
jgi:hypothetical protein